MRAPMPLCVCQCHYACAKVAHAQVGVLRLTALAAMADAGGLDLTAFAAIPLYIIPNF